MYTKVVLSFGLFSINDKTQQWPVHMHAFDAEPTLVDKKTSTVLHPYSLQYTGGTVSILKEAWVTLWVTYGL